ncbi:MAG: NPCBM/NEW2 domain-containing protein, partial [Planctomycetia bacterium]
LALATLLAAAAAPLRAADEGPALEVVAVDGSVVRGTLLSLGASLALSVPGQAAPRTFEVSGLREARSGGPPVRPAQDRLRLTLVGGEVLLAEAWGPAPDGIEVTARALGKVVLPLDVVRCLEPLPSRAGPCHEPAARFPPVAGRDRAALSGGDELAGTLLAVQADGIAFEVERGRERSVAWADLLVAQLDNAPAPARDVLVTEVETTSGDLLRATAQVTGDRDGLVVPLASDGAVTVRVPAAQVRTLRWRGGPHPCVDATTLPFEAVTRPLLEPPAGSLAAEFLARERGVRVGRRPRGCPLRLDGVTYLQGFAVHGGSSITLPLGGRFARFEALVGIDDEAEAEGRGRVEVPGDVDVRVLGDGKVLWEAKGVQGLQSARKVGPLDVRGVQSLVLAVDHGGHDDVLDRVTWASPLLVR